jgi:predicted acyl esterase
LDLFAAIQKFDSDGHQVYFHGFGGTNPNDVVSRGWLRVSHRALDPQASRPDRPVHTHRREEKLSPGEIVPVEIELLPSGTLFRAGERLRIRVQGQAIQPDAVLLKFATIGQGRARIWAGGQFDSHLLLPVAPLSLSTPD